jgi:hypothetical protein
VAKWPSIDIRWGNPRWDLPGPIPPFGGAKFGPKFSSELCSLLRPIVHSGCPTTVSLSQIDIPLLLASTISSIILVLNLLRFADESLYSWLVEKGALLVEDLIVMNAMINPILYGYGK